MSAITPSTNVKLLKLPLELDNENQLTFSSASAQYSYFNSLPSLAANNFTYQRKDGVIRFPGCIDDLLQYNYVMYQNSAFGNKWFYAYIDKMTFVSPEMTDISIRTDPFQTWQFDITFLESFVEREHVDDDTVGKHTIPEDVQKGDYVCHINGNRDIILGGQMYYVVGTTQTIGTFRNDDDITTEYFPAHKINGCPHGLSYALFETPSLAKQYCDAFVKDSKKDAIISMFVIPRNMFYQTEGSTTSNTARKAIWYNNADPSSASESINCWVPASSDNESELLRYEERVRILKPYEFYFNYDEYVPHNNKLFTYPFCYFTITNNNGTAVNYHFEDFYDVDPEYNTADFMADGCFSAGGGIKLYPIGNYKNVLISGTPELTTNSYMFGINSGKFPMMSWSTDEYTNWLTQNAVNIPAKIIAPTASGAIVGGAPMAAAGFVGGVASTISEVYAASKIPDQVDGDYNNGDLMFSKNNCAFSVYIMTIKPEYARLIDRFFDMFGYKVNSVKTPNITGRRNWNYVKTIRGKIHGYIPKEDLNTISGMLDNGVTFWHSPSTFLDYSQTNDII